VERSCECGNEPSEYHNILANYSVATHCSAPDSSLVLYNSLRKYPESAIFSKQIIPKGIFLSRVVSIHDITIILDIVVIKCLLFV
jgi:hypothetical protein